MANKEVGEVKLVADGATYTLRFGSYAIAQLETELDRPMLGIALELEDENKRRMKTLVAALWAAMQEHHPEDQPGGVDMRKAYSILDAAGFTEAGNKIAECLNLAFPDAGEGQGANPPNRRARRKAAATAR